MTSLLRPHAKSLFVALMAVIGAGISNLLQPWPLKIVIDVASGVKPLNGRLEHLFGADLWQHKTAVVELAALALLTVAALGAACSFIQDHITTEIGQWISYDLRTKLYNHIQQLSLRYHRSKDTGDLISRLTTDIDSVQSFLAAAGLRQVDGRLFQGVCGLRTNR